MSFDVGNQVLSSTSNINLKIPKQGSCYLDELVLLTY